MKKSIILVLMFVAVTGARAQDERTTAADSLVGDVAEKVVELGEVTVEHARVVEKADGKLIIPSLSQRNSTTNGYDLLSKLNLPRIRVDEVMRTVTALGNEGAVQIRINGIVATKEDLIGLSPKLVKNIDFIDNPGVRYGKETGVVIDIRTYRHDSGGAVGADLSNSITAWNGNNSVFARVNHGKSEWGINYNLTYCDFKGAKLTEIANYLLNDGSVYHIERATLASRNRTFDHTLQLKYSLADSASYVFQVSLSANLNKMPNDDERQSIVDGLQKMIATRRNSSNSNSPVLDLYFYHRLGEHQSLTTNVVGTGITTENDSYQDEGVPYSYNVDGRTWSLHSEVIYENRLKPFTITMGLAHGIKYTRNEYKGDVQSLNQMHNHDLYLFSEVKGMSGKLSYVAGLGVTNQRYRQSADKFNYWLFRPKLTLSYHLVAPLSLRYSFEIYEHVSKIAMISNTMIRENSREWRVGNPNIEPNKVVEQTLSLSYNKPRFTNTFDIAYRNNSHPNMSKYIRTADNQFHYLQANQKRIEMFYLQNAMSCDIIPDKLTCTLTGGVFRFLNKGDEYKHYLTSAFVSGSLNAYLGRWVISAYADNGWKFVEGETQAHHGSYVFLKGAYRVGNLILSLYWQNPLISHPRLEESAILNRFVSKKQLFRGSDNGNLLNLSVSWKFEYGRRYRDVQKKLGHKDTQTGIM